MHVDEEVTIVLRRGLLVGVHKVVELTGKELGAEVSNLQLA